MEDHLKFKRQSQGRIQLFEKGGGIKLTIKLGRGGGAPSRAPTIYFKELALRVNILSAQTIKLLLKYVKFIATL